MLLKNRMGMFAMAVGLGLCLGWVLAAQQPAGPQFKDRAEYDLAISVDQQKTPQDALRVLKEWETKYPQTDYLPAREDGFLATYKLLKDARNAFESAKKIRARKPEHLLALDAIVTQVYALGNPIPLPDLAYAEQTGQYIGTNLNTIFAPANRPVIMTEQAFPAYRPTIQFLAQRIVAIAPYQREEWPKAEAEIRKLLALDATQALFSQFLGKALFEQRQAAPDKQPNAIYHYARSAAYTGKNALAAADRTQMTAYVTNLYKQYHCSDEGLAALMDQAKNNVMPPAGFSIKSCVDIEREKIISDNRWKEEHPDLAFWRDIVRAPLQAADGESYWANVEGAGLPTEAIGKLSGTVISSTQEKGNTKQVVVAVFEPTLPDATLNLVEPLPGMPTAGDVIKFKGEAKSYVKEPFHLTFDVNPDDVEGWTGVAATPAKGGKGGAKGKAAPKGKAAK